LTVIQLACIVFYLTLFGVCRIDVTEGQISITLLYLVCALFGSSFWSYEVRLLSYVYLYKTDL